MLAIGVARILESQTEHFEFQSFQTCKIPKIAKKTATFNSSLSLSLSLFLRTLSSDYNVQPSNLAFTANPLFAKNLPPVVYNEKFEGGRAIPYIIKSQPQFQTRSMQQSLDLNNIVDFLVKVQKSLENISPENSKKGGQPAGRMPPAGEKWASRPPFSVDFLLITWFVT